MCHNILHHMKEHNMFAYLGSEYRSIIHHGSSFPKQSKKINVPVAFLLQTLCVPYACLLRTFCEHLASLEDAFVGLWRALSVPLALLLHIFSVHPAYL